MTTVGAIPERLLGYASAAIDLNEEIARANGEASDARLAFINACPDAEFSPAIPYQPEEVAAHVTLAHQTDAWVGAIGRAFEQADSGRPMVLDGWHAAVMGPDTLRTASRTVVADEAEILSILLGAEDYDPFATVESGDPQLWQRMLHPAYCEFTYDGGGFVTGPDGLRYPIVALPQVDVNLPPYQSGAATLFGSDPGWSALYVHQGLTEIGDETPAWQKWIIGLGIATGGPTPSGQYLGSEAYGLLSFGVDGIPHFDAIGHGNPDALPEIPSGSEPPMLMPVQLRDGRIVDIDTHDPETWPREVRRRGVAGYQSYQRRTARLGGLDLAVMGAQGVNVATNLDNDRTFRYQVRFEVNDDGRRRALVTAANVFQGTNLATGQEELRLNSYHVRAGESGMELKPVTYKEWEWDEPPTIGPVTGHYYSVEEYEEADPLPVVRPEPIDPTWSSPDE